MVTFEEARDALNARRIAEGKEFRVAVAEGLKAGMTQAEIARRLGRSRQSVSVAVQRARAEGLL